MAMRIDPPTFNTLEKSYERYKQELLAWREVTNLDKTKQGIAIALTLPDNDSKNIREKVFDEISVDNLKKDDGLDTLIKIFDGIYKKEDLSDCFERYEQFEALYRSPDQSMEDFLSEYDSRYK